MLDGVPDPLESLVPIPPGTAIVELLEISITELEAGSDGDDILLSEGQMLPMRSGADAAEQRKEQWR